MLQKGKAARAVGATTVALDAHAAATLHYIRASMDAATLVAVPGSAGMAMGAVGLFAATLANTPALRGHWLPLWLTAAVIAGAVGGSLVLRQSSLRGLGLSGTPMRKFLLCLLPPLFAGAALTAVHVVSGNLRAVPGTWLLLYGCALMAASALTTRLVATLGGLFAVLGLTALALPAEWQNLALGIGFGGLHVLFGILIGRVGHGSQT